MASPFAPYANITVCFQLPTDTEGADGLPVKPLVCMAYGKRRRLEQAKRREQLQDGELAQLEFHGFWVVPTVKPQAILAEQTGKAYVWRVVPGQFQLPTVGFSSVGEYEAFVEANRRHIAEEGDFVLSATPPGPFGVEAQTGDRFEGELVTRVAWADTV